MDDKVKDTELRTVSTSILINYMVGYEVENELLVGLWCQTGVFLSPVGGFCFGGLSYEIKFFYILTTLFSTLEGLLDTSCCRLRAGGSG